MFDNFLIDKERLENAIFSMNTENTMDRIRENFYENMTCMEISDNEILLKYLEHLMRKESLESLTLTGYNVSK